MIANYLLHIAKTKSFVFFGVEHLLIPSEFIRHPRQFSILVLLAILQLASHCLLLVAVEYGVMKGADLRDLFFQYPLFYVLKMQQSFVFRHHAEVGQLLLQFMVFLTDLVYLATVGSHPRPANGLVGREGFVEFGLLFVGIADASDQREGFVHEIGHVGLDLIGRHNRKLLQGKLD